MHTAVGPAWRHDCRRRRPRAYFSRQGEEGAGATPQETSAMNRPEPPETAIKAMLLLTALAVGLVLFVEFIAKNLR